jgi:putative FmdB family regulatory protein
MPLYEYECFLCGHRFERIQRVSDSPADSCPECSGSVRRLLGAPALQFKGSGFYITDYGKGNGNRPSTDSSGKPATDAKPEKTPPKESTSKDTVSSGADS